MIGANVRAAATCKVTVKMFVVKAIIAYVQNLARIYALQILANLTTLFGQRCVGDTLVLHRRNYWRKTTRNNFSQKI